MTYFTWQKVFRPKSFQYLTHMPRKKWCSCYWCLVDKRWTIRIHNIEYEGSKRLTPRWMSGGPHHAKRTFLFLSEDIKNTKYAQYAPVVWHRWACRTQDFGKLVMICMWHNHDMALWRHGICARHNNLFRTTASNVNCLSLLATWLDCGEKVIRKL